MFSSTQRKQVLVIGAGPAGLMAADVLSAFAEVVVCDAMPTAGRKFLMAGVGGMNITHSESFDQFVSRYRDAAHWLQPLLQQFGATELREWIHGFGIETFVGTSGRVFPREMKAAPLLRAWLQRLKNNGVVFHMRHRWLGADANNQHRFSTEAGEKVISADAVVLALGGGSWAKLGSDGAWVTALQRHAIDVAPLLASNCGFECQWSDFFREKMAGEPVKPVALTVVDQRGNTIHKQGEFVITQHGIEGSLIYAVSAELRHHIVQNGYATLHLDLLPQLSLFHVQQTLAKPRGSKTLSSVLQSRFGIKGVKTALLHEVLNKQQMQDMNLLAQTLKSLPLTVTACRPIDEAISTAGGVRLSELDHQMMLRKWPGVFCAGEMLDWEAPTGGYLLTACFATGYAAGLGVKNFLKL